VTFWFGGAGSDANSNFASLADSKLKLKTQTLFRMECHLKLRAQQGTYTSGLIIHPEPRTLYGTCLTAERTADLSRRLQRGAAARGYQHYFHEPAWTPGDYWWIAGSDVWPQNYQAKEMLNEVKDQRQFSDCGKRINCLTRSLVQDRIKAEKLKKFAPNFRKSHSGKRY